MTNTIHSSHYVLYHCGLDRPAEEDLPQNVQDEGYTALAVPLARVTVSDGAAVGLLVRSAKMVTTSFRTTGSCSCYLVFVMSLLLVHSACRRIWRVHGIGLLTRRRQQLWPHVCKPLANRVRPPGSPVNNNTTAAHLHMRLCQCLLF